MRSSRCVPTTHLTHPPEDEKKKNIYGTREQPCTCVPHGVKYNAQIALQIARLQLACRVTLRQAQPVVACTTATSPVKSAGSSDKAWEEETTRFPPPAPETSPKMTPGLVRAVKAVINGFRTLGTILGGR